ncbi:MAG TPA: hypothetical protein VFD43_11435 [Planctomycetota bacterium]|nr:hypothetical protein [Planctomycetota bacterium]
MPWKQASTTSAQPVDAAVDPAADFVVLPADEAGAGAQGSPLAAYSVLWTDPAGTVVLEQPPD